MNVGTIDLHHASRTQLIGLARDALRIAAHPTLSGQNPSTGGDLAMMVGLLGHHLEALDRALNEVGDAVTREVAAGRVVVRDGVFEGDPQAAAESVALWVTRAREAVAAAQPALVNAHIAAGGLASAG